MFILCFSPELAEKHSHDAPGIPQTTYANTSQFSADYLEKQPYRAIIWDRYFEAHGYDKNMIRHSDDIATLLFCYDLPDMRRGKLKLQPHTTRDTHFKKVSCGVFSQVLLSMCKEAEGNTLLSFGPTSTQRANIMKPSHRFELLRLQHN